MTRKLTLADAYTAAEAKGGKCLSPTYIDNRTKMLWECGTCGYIWSAILASIRNLNSWCPDCSGNTRLTIEVAKRIAVMRGGECLSEEYKNNNLPLLWRCNKDGTEWPASLNKVKDASQWCPTCAGNLPLTLDEAKQIAVTRGGICLSVKYSNIETPLKWQCGKCGNSWEASLKNIKNGKWCPYCKNKNELATREVFERLTGGAFPLRRGLFEANRRWQLDGYCPELGVAFEYNGRQHYEYMPVFHRNGEEDLKKQKERDARILEDALELDQPVYIIVVPYWLSVEDRKTFIWKELWALGVLATQYDNATGIPPF